MKFSIILMIPKGSHDSLEENSKCIFSFDLLMLLPDRIGLEQSPGSFHKVAFDLVNFGGLLIAVTHNEHY